MSHELADEVRAALRVGIVQPTLKRFQRQIAVPEEVGSALSIEQEGCRRRIQHTS